MEVKLDISFPLNLFYLYLMVQKFTQVISWQEHLKRQAE
jgi:hypothetical protein